MDIKETIQQIKSCFVLHSTVIDVMQRIELLLEDQSLGGEPEHLMIIGEPGVGKSRLLQRFAKRFPSIHHDTFIEQPVVYLEVPSNCTPKKLIEEILVAMGSPFAERGDVAQKTRQLKALFKGCKVRMVLLDEANHLVERGTNKSFYQMADALKELANTSNVIWVLAGVQQTRALIDANDQLRSRFRDVVTLRAFSTESPELESGFVGVLKVLQSLLGPFSGVDFADQCRAHQMLYACGGRLRELRKLLVRALQLAAKRAPVRLSDVDLRDAFHEVIFPNVPANRDPFSKDFDGYPLIRLGEPFAEARRT